mgnify:CR=1 FL=1
MIQKIIFIFIGYIFMTIGITYIILYTNLFTFGYTIKEYLEFLLTQVEIYFLPIGILIEFFSIKGDRK